MKILLPIICIILLLLAIVIFKVAKLKNIEYQEPEILRGKKTVTIYYSHCNNTKDVAQNLQSIIGGDLKEIKLKEKYPSNIFEMSKLIRKQMKQGYLPEIENIDISSYDVIFVGSAIWNFSISLPMQSFLKNNNFENKTIIPFFTYSGGANKNKIKEEVKKLTQIKDVKKPLFMFENGIFLKKEQIINWLNKI